MTILLNILKFIWPYVLTIVITFAAAYECYHFGVVTTSHQYETKLAELDVKDAKADEQRAIDRAALIERQRKTEADWNQNVVDLETFYGDKLKNEIANRDSTINALRLGSFRVRSSLTCNANAAASGSNPAKSSGNSNATSQANQSGFQTADAEFLLRAGSDADEVVGKFNQCVDMLRVERGLQPFSKSK